MNRRDIRSDRGQAVLEYIGFVPILLLVALCGIQLGWVAYAEQQAGTAARVAARVQARYGEGGEAAGRAAISEGLGETAEITVNRSGGIVTAHVTLKASSIVPGIGPHFAKRTVVMADDDPKGP